MFRSTVKYYCHSFEHLISLNFSIYVELLWLMWCASSPLRCFTPALKYYIRGFSNTSDVALQQEREVRFRFMPDASGRRLLWRHLKEATFHSGGFHTGSSTTFAIVQLISQKQRQRRPWATDHSGGSHRILFQPIWQIFNFFLS